MSRLQRFALLTELADQLRAAGSWAGETNLQKAAYFVQELFQIDSNFDFILYRHGPFSFDLRDDLTELRANGLIEFIPMPPYGPRIHPTTASEELRRKFPTTLRRVSPAISFVAAHLGDQNVIKLERLATALYVLKNSEQTADIDQMAARVHEIKPHVSVDKAKSALATVQQLMDQAGVLGEYPHAGRYSKKVEVEAK